MSQDGAKGEGILTGRKECVQGAAHRQEFWHWEMVRNSGMSNLVLLDWFCSWKGLEETPHGEKRALKENSDPATNQGAILELYQQPVTVIFFFFVNSTSNIIQAVENTHFLFAGGFAELIVTEKHRALFLLSGTSLTESFTFYEDK